LPLLPSNWPRATHHPSITPDSDLASEISWGPTTISSAVNVRLGYRHNPVEAQARCGFAVEQPML
ncbi:MAG: hypothetical protein M3N19_08610, partial [Candidatus Eremiobacteraeota bacterium]|nr:hypothetical protein [Candidatus Eremiobacteraeota bacterium]